jgi:hypothetical protein
LASLEIHSVSNALGGRFTSLINEPDAGGDIHVVAQSGGRTDGTLPSWIMLYVINAFKCPLRVARLFTRVLVSASTRNSTSGCLRLLDTRNREMVSREP